MAKNERINIISIALNVIFIITIGVFIYVQANNGDSIYTLTNVLDSYRARNKLLVGQYNEVREQLDIYSESFERIEQRNKELRKQLDKIKERNTTLEQYLDGSISITGNLSNRNREIEKAIKDSLQLIRELKDTYTN